VLRWAAAGVVAVAFAAEAVWVAIAYRLGIARRGAVLTEQYSGTAARAVGERGFDHVFPMTEAELPGETSLG